MKTRVEKTIEKHDRGYNCAQAVACTYCDLVGIDEQTMFKLAEALGLGMGSMEGTCGALSGACLLAGAHISSGNLKKPDSKTTTYRSAKEIMTRFQAQNGSVICKELKGVGGAGVLRKCPDCIKDAAKLVEDVLLGDTSSQKTEKEGL